MALYGFGATPGKLAWTGFSNTLGSSDDASTPSTSGYVNFVGLTSDDKIIAQILHLRDDAKTRAVWKSGTGFAPTHNSGNLQRVRVQGTAALPMGGDNYNSLRDIQNGTYAGAFGAAQKTAVLALIDRVVYPATYPVDASGNGGGGKGAW